jgi:GNAT superfamily N-acetyltransferase
MIERSADIVPVRLAEHQDLPALLALNQQLNPEDLPLPAPDEVAQVWKQLLDNPVMHTFVAERSGRVVATCVLAILPNLTRGTRPYGLIENVVVDQAVRGQGVGRELMQAVLSFAWRQRCYKVMLLTGRPEVVGFYQQVGFQTEGKIGLIAKPPKEGWG